MLTAILTTILKVSVVEEYSFAAHIESGTLVHLPLEHFDPIDTPFTSIGTARQGWRLAGSTMVGVEPSNEAMHVWYIICCDGSYS